jgi:hypothetical protein
MRFALLHPTRFPPAGYWRGKSGHAFENYPTDACNAVITAMEKACGGPYAFKEVLNESFEYKLASNKRHVDSESEEGEEGPEAYVLPFVSTNTPGPPKYDELQHSNMTVTPPPSYKEQASDRHNSAQNMPPGVPDRSPAPIVGSPSLASVYGAVEPPSPFRSPLLDGDQVGAPLPDVLPPPLLPIVRPREWHMAGAGLPPPLFGGEPVGAPLRAVLQPEPLAPPPRRVGVKIRKVDRALRLLAPYGTPGRLEGREARALRAPRRALLPPPPGMNVRRPAGSRWYYEAV